MMKKIFRFALLALSLCVLLSFAADGKYVIDFVPLNYMRIAPGGMPSAFHPGDSALFYSVPVYGNDTRGVNQGRYGFDFVYYTPPVHATPGSASNGSSRTEADGAQMILTNCPAGWYAFKLLGASGGNGNIDIGYGGAGGGGATVSGFTYIQAGTIVLRAGRAGVSHKPSGSTLKAQWGGGLGANDNIGGGGGYSGIFRFAGTPAAESNPPTLAERQAWQAAAVAIAGGGGGGGKGRDFVGADGVWPFKTGRGGRPGGYGGTRGTSATGEGAAGSTTNTSGGASTTAGGTGSGGGGGGGGGCRGWTSSDGAVGTGGAGGVLTHNNSGTVYYGGGAGGGGAGGVNDDAPGGKGGGQIGGTGAKNGGSGSALLGGDGNSRSGAGGGGYAGGAGGGHNHTDCAGGGAGGGSSYLQTFVYPLAHEAAGACNPTCVCLQYLPDKPSTNSIWYGQTSPTISVSYGNGYVWIMYLGARHPGDTQAITPEKGIADSGGYVDIS